MRLNVYAEKMIAHMFLLLGFWIWISFKFN